MKKNVKRAITISIFILLAAYMLTGIYSLQSGQIALILRFGKVVSQINTAGIHYSLPVPVDRLVKLNASEIQKVSTHELSASGSKSGNDYESIGVGSFRFNASSFRENFTGDENLIKVNSVISYDIKDPKDYLFNITDVVPVIKTTGLNVLCGELAKMNVDNVMTTGKSLLKLVMKDKIQEQLDKLQTGVRIISVELTDIAPPRDVVRAFKAVSDARVKKQEIIKESEGYSNSVIPQARGEARSLLASANAYADELLNSANSRVEAFNELYREYRRNPGIITRQRYLETMQRIYSINEVKIDSDPDNSIYYIRETR